MIISLIIIILLIYAFRYGIRRGLLGSLVSLLGYIIVFILSLLLASPLGNIITDLFSNINDGSGLLAMTFYKILSFWIIGIIGGIIVRILANVSRGFTKLPVISQFNALLGGILTTIMMYVVIFFGLILLSNWPSQKVKQTVEESRVAVYILDNTPNVMNRIVSM
ncbi:CvpA family protein [Lactobacillus salivarius]|uniref:CvpA family protein n=1 Tax=Ligilactobacillus salivarius TaxID=1624 RepID=UPI0015C5908F|nr:CvpA family protein [Ligilactobacillus salivarius]MCI6063312.1 CvpA family protein [Ligilactobacillus salivarius]MDY5291760.1 CvpA family protein [Ligilactobacillus salivarius]NXZ96555.1 CvpA family protein [Ligilactobacillus salivarius]NYA61138.1 CvpA family protein [Ligilactobacillus salivarius]NYA66982.1 CvpA family protein [Ligilactobacillus salivarius]